MPAAYEHEEKDWDAWRTRNRPIFERANSILPDSELTDIEQTASWHGFADMGSYRSIDNELASASKMQDAIPKLVKEIRRLRSLLPEEQRVLVAAPRRYRSASPMPPPPFEGI